MGDQALQDSLKASLAAAGGDGVIADVVTLPNVREHLGEGPNSRRYLLQIGLIVEYAVRFASEDEALVAAESFVVSAEMALANTVAFAESNGYHDVTIGLIEAPTVVEIDEDDDVTLNPGDPQCAGVPCEARNSIHPSTHRFCAEDRPQLCIPNFLLNISPCVLLIFSSTTPPLISLFS